MATPTAKPNTGKPSPRPQLEVVDPRWLFKALALAVLAAIILSYAALCLLLYQGSWQILLHPSAKSDQTPPIRFEAIRFDAATAGTPRLTGWWIPAEESAFQPSRRTLLFLHDGTGSLSDSADRLALLHRAGVSVFAFDYRGFGQSAGPHPTEARMNEDAEAALDYLLATRHIPITQVVPYGEGLGAVLAVRLVAHHTSLPAVVLENPLPDALSRAVTDRKARLLPMRLLVHDRFDIEAELHTCRHPKLLLANSPDASDPGRTRANQTMFRNTPDPKMTVTFDPIHADQALLDALQRFLDGYAPG